MTPVDLVVNCFERTYRQLLAPGGFERIVAGQARRFPSRTVLVNNVDDRASVEALAAARIEAGEIDRVQFVADHLPQALERTGLRATDLGPQPYFIDWCLVVVCLDGPDLVVHWDADAVLREPVDWVTPAADLLQRDPRVLTANPNWEAPTLARETLEDAGPFALGFGFSDQAFLGRRSELGRPIYGERTVATWRYPYPASYEARVDAHLRRAGRRRATYRDAVYVHGTPMGTSWPHRTWRDRANAAGRDAVVRGLRAAPDRLLPAHLRAI